MINDKNIKVYTKRSALSPTLKYFYHFLKIIQIVKNFTRLRKTEKKTNANNPKKNYILLNSTDESYCKVFAI